MLLAMAVMCVCMAAAEISIIPSREMPQLLRTENLGSLTPDSKVTIHLTLKERNLDKLVSCSASAVARLIVWPSDPDRRVSQRSF